MRCWPAARHATLPDRGPRLAAGILVSALIRRIAVEGGSGMVLAKGDPTSGAILAVLAERGRTGSVLERSLGPDGYLLRPVGPGDPDAPGALSEYIARRRRSDPDLWVVELDGETAGAIAQDLLG